MKLDTNSLAHTKWECKYHIVFAPKYRRQIIYGKIRQDIGQMIRKLCEYKGVEIIEAEACKDHIHMLISMPPKYSVSQFMGYLKWEKQSNDIRKICELKVAPLGAAREKNAVGRPFEGPLGSARKMP